jgi:hypothetical protein
MGDLSSVKTPIRRFRALPAISILAACATIQGTGRAQTAVSPSPPPPPSPPADAPPAPATPATSPTLQAPPPPATSHGNTAAWVTGGLAIAAAATGTVFGVIALGDKSDFEKQPTYSKANAGNDSAAYCDAAFGAALVLGATSVILLLAHDDPPPATASRSVTLTASPVVTPHGGGVGAVLRF